jgi:ketosteroid isomerase-like protein
MMILKALPIEPEFRLRMKRFLLSLSALLLACIAASGQNLTANPAPAKGDAPADVPAGVTTTVSPEVTQFQKIEDSWSDAVNRRDQYGLELVLSPLFLDVSAGGDVTTRNQQVAMVINGEDKSLYLTQKVITVRMLGDTAVVNGTYTLRHKVNSTPMDEKGVYTHVFERVRGGWLCINSQRTVLRQDTNAKQKKQATPESPFHIPLFSKGDKGPE